MGFPVCRNAELMGRRRSRPTWVLSVRRTASTLSHSGMVPWYKKSEFFLQPVMVIKVCVLPNRGGA